MIYDISELLWVSLSACVFLTDSKGTHIMALINVLKYVLEEKITAFLSTVSEYCSR
jgi:hypothetical protein